MKVVALAAAAALAGCISAPTPPGPAGVGRHWVKRDDAGHRKPKIRSSPRLTYDSTRGHVMMYGGSTINEGVIDDLWRLDDDGWTLVCSPCIDALREEPAFAYDPKNDRLVLALGDDREAPNYPQEMWELALSTTMWKQTLATPSGRQMTQFVYDTSREQLVLVGGYDGGAKQDLWALDGTTFTEIKLRGDAPYMASRAQTASYDSDRNQLVVLQGTAGGTYRSEIWRMDDDRFEMICTECAPTGIDYNLASLVYIPVYDQTYLIGPRDPAGVGHTYELTADGKVTELATSPPRDLLGVAYDAQRDVVVAYGGSIGNDLEEGCDHDCDSTWELVRD